MVSLNKNIDHWLLNYYTYSMIIGLISGLLVLAKIFFCISVNIPDLFFIISVLFLVSAIGGYLLVPTHIYPKFSPMKIYSKEYWFYYAFIFFTIGIGPAAMYFIRWKAIIKSKMVINGGPGL